MIGRLIRCAFDTLERVRSTPKGEDRYARPEFVSDAHRQGLVTDERVAVCSDAGT